MRGGDMVRAFETAVKLILKLSTEATEVRDLMQSLVSQMHSSGIYYSEGVREFKRNFIGHVLDKHHGNQCKAARELGMHRNTLSRTLAELNINPAEYAPKRSVQRVGKDEFRKLA